MKRHFRDIKKIIWMKWRLLAFTKSVTRRLARFHSLKIASPKSDESKKVLKSFKSDEPKKVSQSPGLIDDPSEKEQKPKKASRPSDGKNAATKAGKKVKKTSQPKKVPKSP